MSPAFKPEPIKIRCGEQADGTVVSCGRHDCPRCCPDRSRFYGAAKAVVDAYDDDPVDDIWHERVGECVAALRATLADPLRERDAAWGADTEITPDPAMDCAFCDGHGEVVNPGNGDATVAVLEWLRPVICPRCGGTGREPNHG